MAEGIVYLDVDDEITSAASRIRSSPGTKVVLVVPYGSRIATSRMNFRLLSREALVSNRRLSIVSGDAAARSLAASAGLPVFGTVGEYESSLGQADVIPAEAAVAPSVDEPPAGQPAAVVAAVPAAAVAAAPTLFESDTIAVPAPDPSEPRAEPRKSQRPRRPAPEPEATPLLPAPSPEDEPLDQPLLPPILGRRLRAPVAAAIGIAVLALIVLGVGAYLLLPSASIVITPRRETIGPLQLTVSADPEATAVDPIGLVVPAVRVEVPVDASRTFETTGKHTELTAASGAVTFENYNFLSSNTVAAGSIVSTEGGIKFRTLAAVTLPAADFVLPSVVPSRRSVNVAAVKGGPDGNVPANSIRVVPPGENPEFLKVNNPDPTGGGTRTETPQVSKAEIDKALATLRTDIQAAFDAKIASGTVAPAGTTLFPTTADLGTITPDGDPQAVVGQAVASYELRVTATGTVIAVDPSPLRSIAETQISSHVSPGHELVDGSASVHVGDGLIGEDGEVSFLATASATQETVVDANAVRELVKGKTRAEAEAALASLGRATVTLWPDWVTTVPATDSRLTISVEPGAEGPAGSLSPRPSPTGSPPTASPAATPS